MTISTELGRVTQDGNGVTTAFNFGYPFHKKSDLVVKSIVKTTGQETVLVLDTNYTITGSTDPLGHYTNGGVVTITPAPASTVRIVIYRDPDYTQETDLTDNDSLPAESVEATLDYILMQVLRLKDRIDRTLRQPDGDGTALTDLAPAVSRANKYLGFDANGQQTLISNLAANVPIEFGSFVPVLKLNTMGDFTVTYTSQVGYYIKIGRFVFLFGEVIWSNLTNTTGSGGLRLEAATLSDIPIAWASGARGMGPVVMTGFDSADGITQIVAHIQPNTNFLIFPALFGASGLHIPLVNTNLQTGVNGNIYFSCLYDVGP